MSWYETISYGFITNTVIRKTVHRIVWTVQKQITVFWYSTCRICTSVSFSRLDTGFEMNNNWRKLVSGLKYLKMIGYALYLPIIYNTFKNVKILFLFKLLKVIQGNNHKLLICCCRNSKIVKWKKRLDIYYVHTYICRY